MPLNLPTPDPERDVWGQQLNDALTALDEGKASLGADGLLPESQVPERLTESALEATTASQIARRRSIYHLDAYEDFFGSAAGWVDGQGVTSTWTTGAPAGATTVPVADTTGFLAGMQVLTGRATEQQTIHVIASVGASGITFADPIPYALASGEVITPLWNNSAHLGPSGWIAFAYWIANATDSETGEYVITGTTPRVTILGDSWISQGGDAYADQITARIPGATVVNAGVAGDSSTNLLARFDADVPADSDFVVLNEPGVNDDILGVDLADQAANLEALVAKVRGIGAVPIYTGHVPLVDIPAVALHRHTATKGAIGSGYTFPGISWGGTANLLPRTPEADSLAVGDEALRQVTTGAQNTAVGVRAGAALSSAPNNVFVGREAGTSCTTGPSNVGVGHNALRSLTSGANNVAVGQASLSSCGAGSFNAGLGRNTLLANTGHGNAAIGYNAGYAPNGVAADAITTGSYNTCIGYQTGGKPTSSYSTAVGSNAVALEQNATALGSATSAGGAGSVAIGRDSAGTGAATTTDDEMALGTALHRVKVAGRLNIAPRTPTGSSDASGAVGDIAADDDYVYVKTSTGWKRAALAAW